MFPRALIVLSVALLSTLGAGCATSSTSSDSRPDQDARLLLDFAPNAIHAGIYLALQRGYDEAEGVHLDVETPGAAGDGIKAVLSGREDLAIVDIHDLAIARAKRKDVVGVMALVQTPLSGLTAFRNAEGVALKAEHPEVRELGVHDHGAPPYPELVLVTSRETLETNAPVVRATIRALRRGYEATITDPESAVSALTDAEPSLKRVPTLEALDAVSPSFTAGSQFYGELNPTLLTRWAAWEQRVGIVKRKPDVATMFDPATARTGLKDDPNAWASSPSGRISRRNRPLGDFAVTGRGCA
jgi:ABC-type nitrate/sulfonate/bicarbonate transport system substrate-binding protein